MVHLRDVGTGITVVEENDMCTKHVYIGNLNRNIKWSVYCQYG